LTPKIDGKLVMEEGDSVFGFLLDDVTELSELFIIVLTSEKRNELQFDQKKINRKIMFW
jgi:hypothetical protein